MIRVLNVFNGLISYKCKKMLCFKVKPIKFFLFFLFIFFLFLFTFSFLFHFSFLFLIFYSFSGHFPYFGTQIVIEYKICFVLFSVNRNRGKHRSPYSRVGGRAIPRLSPAHFQRAVVRIPR